MAKVTPVENRLSIGSTLLNLVCSDDPTCGMVRGKYHWMAGHSSSGKTFLSLTAFAEAAKNPHWDDVDLVFDDVEGGAMMDFPRFFGQKMADRVMPPSGNWDEPGFSTHLEHVYSYLTERIENKKKWKGKPFLYLLDSHDAVTTLYAEKKWKELKREADGGKAAKGDFGDGKAAINSRQMRLLISDLERTGNTVMFLSQTRDNVNAGMFESPDKISGGHALKFYALWQMMSKRGATITRTINGTKREIGMISRVKVSKNRLTGKEWTVDMPIYHSYGIDDIGACVDLLLREKHWDIGADAKKKAGKESPARKRAVTKSGDDGDEKKMKITDTSFVNAPDFKFSGTRRELIRKIEADRLQLDLIDITTDVWHDLVAKLDVGRPCRFE